MKKGLFIFALLGTIVAAGIGSTTQAEFSPGPGPQGVVKDQLVFDIGPGPMSITKG